MATRTLSNLVWPDGQSNPSGMKSIAYFMFKRDIKSWPKIPGVAGFGGRGRHV